MPGAIRVLYVDDDPNLLVIAQYFLEGGGEFSVGTFTSAKAALASPDIRACDAIVSDYQMSGMDGIRFLQEVRRQFGDIPFILLTGRGREEIVIDAINSGVDFYLQKGGDPTAQFAELAHKIRQAVTRRRAEHLRTESEKRLSEIINFLPDATFAIDKTGHVIAWNRAMEVMTGRPAPEMLGKGEYEYAIPFYGTRRPILIDMVFSPQDEVREKYTFIQRDKGGITAETTTATPSGKQCILWGRAAPLIDSEGAVTGAIESIREISEWKRAEESLRESERKYRELADLLPQIVFETDRDLNLTYANRQGLSLFGFSDEDLARGIGVFSYIDPADHASVRDSIQKIQDGIPFEPKEYTAIRKDGSTFPVMIYTSPVYREGTLTGFRGVAIDISARKKMEDELRESEGKFRSIFENSPYPVAINSLPDTRFLAVNRAFLDTSEYSETEVIGRDPVELGILSVIDMQSLAGFRTSTGKIEHVPLTVTAKTGKRIPVLFSTTQVIFDRKPAIVTMTVDVAKLRHAEEELLKTNEQLHAAYEELTATSDELQQKYNELQKKEETIRASEEKFRTLVGLSLDGIVILDLSGTILFVNRAAALISGVEDYEAVTGRRNVLDFIAPESRADALRDLDLISRGITTNLVQYRLNTTGGREVWVECTGRRIPFGDSMAMLVSMRDITARRQAELALQVSETKFSTVFSANPVPLTLVSATDGSFTDINEAFLHNTGYVREDVIGRRADEIGLFVNEPEYQRFVAALRKEGIVRQMDMQCRIKSGEIRTCQFSSVIILLGGKPQILSTVEDITEQRRAEGAIQESAERYRLILANANDGILVNEMTPRGPGRFIDSNDQACRILGMTRDEMAQKSLVDLDTAEMRSRGPAIMQEIRRNRHSTFQTSYVAPDNREKNISISVSLFDLGGRPTMLSVIRDITDETNRESAIHALVAGMVGATGEGSLDRITESIAAWLSADCIMIGEIAPDNEQVNVLSMLLDGKKVSGYSYTLKGTPCENTAQKGFCSYPDDVARIFPESKDLREFSIRGYAGTSLRNTSGEVIGILCILTRKPLHLPASAREIIAIIAAKAAAEIGQMNALRDLARSEEKFRTLVGYSLDGILIVNTEGTILFANPATARIIDVPDPLDITGSRNIMEFIAPESQADVMHDFEEVARGTDGYLATYRIRTAPGGTRWIESISRKFVFHDAPAIFISLRDITGRRAAEEAFRKSDEILSLVMNGVPTLLAYMDTSLSFVYANKQYAEWYGKTGGELAGMRLDMLLPADVYEREIPYYRQVLGGEEIAFESRVNDSEGRMRVMVVRLVPHIHNEQVTGIFLSLNDVTARRQAEDALRQANKKLNLLTGITRHDIRNQLLALDGFVSIIDDKNPDPALTHYISRIRSVSSQIAGMVQFTREYEEIGVHAPAWQDLRALADEAAETAVAGNVTVENDLPPDTEIYADPLIAKVFFNLADNAVRHGDKVTAIRFSLESRNGSAIIVCTDDGVGVNPDEKDLIFDLGFGKNTGFGLAISREILDITGITITENGEHGRGARFEITVPAGSWRDVKDQS